MLLINYNDTLIHGACCCIRDQTTMFAGGTRVRATRGETENITSIIPNVHGEERIVPVDTSGAFKMIRCINRAS